MSGSIFYNLRHKTKGLNNLSCLAAKYCTSETPIVIPKRIPRKPTDILRAIANTVQKDPTAPHYKYHDDPYLIPYSNLTKRTYALSQEAGRKAAQWIREEHSHLFQHKVADPMIEAFIPKPVINENSHLSEEDLKKAIRTFCTSDAIAVYQHLEQKNIEVSRETIQSFLELLSYYNEQDQLHEDWIEERWFRQGSKSREIPKKTWKDGGLAVKIFHKLEPKDSPAYSAIISGMCKYGQLDAAWKLYQESVQNKVPLSVGTFNTLLSKVNFMKESHDLMWSLVEELLGEMSQRKLRPNIGTLNAVLETISLMATHRHAKMNALGAIAEFKMLGVEPSLASYYHLLNIFCSDKRGSSGILIDIMNHIEGKSFTVVDPKDCAFFLRAMEVCKSYLVDKNLAYRVDQLAHTADNYNLIGDSYLESHYYRNFFSLLTNTEPIEVLMEVYGKLVPHIYIPEPSVMLEILCSVEANAAWSYLPKLWSDIVMFEHSDREYILEKVLELAAKSMDESLTKSMVQIGQDVWEKIEGQKRERNLMKWSGKMLSNLLMIYLQAEEKSKADLAMEKLIKLENSIIGEPDILPLQLFIDACIKESTPRIAIDCLRYCNDVGFLEVNDMARKLNSSLKLSEVQYKNLVDIVGNEVLETKSSSPSL